jgi:hypothetical protein
MKPGVRSFLHLNLRLCLRLCLRLNLRPSRPKPWPRLGGFLTSQAKTALVLLLVLGLSACQNLPTRSDCPLAQDPDAAVRADLMLGSWTVLLWGERHELLTLSPHPEHTGRRGGGRCGRW